MSWSCKPRQVGTQMCSFIDIVPGPRKVASSSKILQSLQNQGRVTPCYQWQMKFVHFPCKGYNVQLRWVSHTEVINWAILTLVKSINSNALIRDGHWTPYVRNINVLRNAQGVAIQMNLSVKREFVVSQSQLRSPPWSLMSLSYMPSKGGSE